MDAKLNYATFKWAVKEEYNYKAPYPVRGIQFFQNLITVFAWRFLEEMAIVPSTNLTLVLWGYYHKSAYRNSNAQLF